MSNYGKSGKPDHTDTAKSRQELAARSYEESGSAVPSGNVYIDAGYGAALLVSKAWNYFKKNK